MRAIRSAVITGPTGSLGQALCRLLLSKEIEVYAVCRPDSPRAKMLPKHPLLHVVACDVREIKMLPDKMNGKKADSFFHFAWVGNDGNNRDNMGLQTSNIQYSLDACHAANKLGCRVYIGAGSQAEYGRHGEALTPDTPCFPENGYGMAKLCAGQMTKTECHLLEMEHVWPRLLSVYGPYEQTSSMIISTIMKLLHGDIPAITSGEQIWDYLFSEDAADAFYRMALTGRDGAVYTVGGGRAHPLREYVEILRDAIDPTMMLDFGAVPYSEKQVMHLEADISALTSDTGFVPKTDFREGIAKTVEWVRSII